MNWETQNQEAIERARSTRVSRQWYVLKVSSQEIPTLIDLLPQTGVVAFAPTEQRQRRIRGQRKVITREQPVMTGYLIAGFIGRPNWFVTFQFPAIFGVVSRNGGPALIDPEALETLYGIHQASVASLPGSKSIKPGDHIRVRSGGYQGHESTLIDIKDDACSFILTLFGKQFTAQMPISEIEAA